MRSTWTQKGGAVNQLLVFDSAHKLLFLCEAPDTASQWPMASGNCWQCGWGAAGKGMHTMYWLKQTSRRTECDMDVTSVQRLDTRLHLHPVKPCNTTDAATQQTDRQRFNSSSARLGSFGLVVWIAIPCVASEHIL
jgi:hypothetical protein